MGLRTCLPGAIRGEAAGLYGRCTGVSELALARVQVQVEVAQGLSRCGVVNSELYNEIRMG